MPCNSGFGHGEPEFGDYTYEHRGVSATGGRYLLGVCALALLVLAAGRWYKRLVNIRRS